MNETILFFVLWLIVVLVFICLRARTVKNLPKWVKKHPNVYQYFAINRMECACLFPKKILDRKLYSLLPKENRGQFPIIAIDAEVILKSPSNGLYLNFSKGASFLLENGMNVYIVWQSLIYMSEKLGIPISKKIRRFGDALVKIDEKESAVLYHDRYFRSRDAISFLFHLVYPLTHKDIERQLRLICGAMNIDYDTACTGSYNPEYSKFYGWGSLAALGIGAVMSGISRQKAKENLEKYNRAIIYISFNEIASCFNQMYYPEAFQTWVEQQEQAVDRFHGNAIAQRMH
jgi:hypothetical protein